jgi:superfamily II DNA or RNA helicase
MATDTIAPGARVRIRDAEWLVQRTDRTSDGGQVLDVVGLSELVEDQEARFIRELEEDTLELIDPAETELRQDTSPGFRQSQLYMESMLRKRAPTDEKLHVGHRAAIDQIPYQWKPALQALEQPRQRILIADATGLGKTMEAGILMSELIERGRGKRILVVALKSMMTQLQKEWWSRFTIPLVRLDSRGIQRIRQRIPANQNPFYYYDKTIISIDTLKRGAEYRTYIEDAYWDIVVVDEAQNAAKRGSTESQRHRLVDQLSSRCDTMIMLSATPHDGSPESFASLMNMLDPTAIANPSDYSREDIDGLFVRRFKNDIKHQVDSAFLDRDIGICAADSTNEEEAVYDELTGLNFTAIDEEGGGDMLFRTTLEKAMFSSPAACLETVENRIDRLEAKEDPLYQNDLQQLRSLAGKLRKIEPRQFSKYQRLLRLLKDPSGLDWDGTDPEDRLVLFSERLETLRFLETNLREELDLSEGAIQKLHGGLSDVEQQEVVEAFGKDEEDVRLLLASDIAAEGINLHYLCHRLIHFDIPWSLMLFQQRNGRIDRYGQTEAPQIRYMVTTPKNEEIHGDLRILQVLIEKEEQAEANIDDPASLMGVYDIEEEEQITADAIESGQTPEDFDEGLDEDETDVMGILLGGDEDGAPDPGEDVTDPISLYDSEFDYFGAALRHLNEHKGAELDFDLYEDEDTVRLTGNDEIKERFKRLPDEIWPEDGVFLLSDDPDEVQGSIVDARKEEHAWPQVQYLWRLHPLSQWADDKVVANFHRNEAPVLTLPALSQEETIVLCSGNVPNRRGQSVVNEWVGVHFFKDLEPKVVPFEEVLDETRLGEKRLSNPAPDVDMSALEDLVPPAVETAREWMEARRDEKNDELNEKLNDRLQELEALQDEHERHLERKYADSDRPASIVEPEKQKERREIERIFDDFFEWAEDTMTIEEEAYIQVIAVLTGISR